ncbi:MAG: hypothetical protein KA419_19780 [Acidobacteria bacterium]|nr:hypothetical protein [Acidobacteriota bacterium]
MIDLHNHVLCEIDDGATDFDHSLRMLEEARRAGVEALACTPHHFHPNFPVQSPGEIVRRFEELRAEAPLTIHLGAEHYFGPDFVDAVERAADTLIPFNGRNHLLLELGSTLPGRYLEPIVFRLRDRGLRPVIAHPERHHDFASNFGLLDRLRELGCALQVNAKSLTGRYGSGPRKTARKLLEGRLAHLVGSDAHQSGDFAHYQEAATWVEKSLGEHYFDLLFIINPWMILNGREPVEAEDLDRVDTILAGIRTGAP